MRYAPDEWVGVCICLVKTTVAFWALAKFNSFLVMNCYVLLCIVMQLFSHPPTPSPYSSAITPLHPPTLQPSPHSIPLLFSHHPTPSPYSSANTPLHTLSTSPPSQAPLQDPPQHYPPRHSVFSRVLRRSGTGAFLSLS